MTGMRFARKALLAFAAVTLATAAYADADVKFAPVDPTWSIPLQITTNGTASAVYAPVSVVTSSMNLKVTFGVTNTATSAVTMPTVTFKIQDATGAVKGSTWTKSGGTLAANKATCIDAGNITTRVGSLAAGNYRLEAKLGTSDTKYFRFAVRDTSKTLASSFTGSWTAINARSGNDFAVPPFAAGTASSGVASGTTPTVQFGPYVPMDGIVEYRPGSEKAPLDLVFLIDLTGSMSGCISGLKSNVETFFRALVEGDADHEPITNWRAKVVGYRDYFVDYSWYEDHPFTTNVLELISQIASCTASGGGDGPESLLDAVWAVSNYTDFRDAASRVMLAFTDIGYKGTGLYHAYEGNTNRLDSSNPQYNVGYTYEDPEYQAYLQEVANEAGLASTEAKLTVKVIASASESYYHFDWLINYCYKTNSSFTYVYDLGSFSSSPDELRNLAGSVSASVKMSEIVEPLLSAKITGPGVLSYEWRNMSEADTNNTFRFKMTGGTTPVEELLPASGSSAWTTQTYVLGSGEHICQWFYKKIGYDGGLIDCGQVRNIAFAVEPSPPVVTATDGTSANYVSVSWTTPTSIGTITSYKVERALKGGTSWTVLGTTASTIRTWEDSTATPGVDYTYRVRAQNSAGWGEYGSDNGWRKVSISLSPNTLTFDYKASSKSVTVTSNTTWEITGRTGCASATEGIGKINVSVTKNESLSSRPGSVTVTAGKGTAHPVSATVNVTQTKRPAILTKLEITGGDRTLEGGESTSFRAIATFDDGTTRDVTTAATWTITAGSEYGTVGAHTGALATHETTATGAGMTVKASYTNSDYSTVTKTDTVNVTITFTARLRRPVSLVVKGDATISIGETKPYTAEVTYNDGTKQDKTLDAATVWTIDPASPFAKIAKGVSAAMLTPYVGGTNLTVAAAYSETVAKSSGSGTELVTVRGTLLVAVMKPIDLAVAVDLKDDEGGPWKYVGIEGISTSSLVGGNVWYGQSATVDDDTDAGQSGHLVGAGTNMMTVVVTKAGTVSFWWKVSSEPLHDALSFSIDGVEKARISGTTDDWRQLSFSVGAGRHTFKWAYGKDGENDEGLDAGWVDQIVWSPLVVPGAPGLVTASDGTSSNGVDVAWTFPSAGVGGVADSYIISREEKGKSGTLTVLTNGVIGTAWTDVTAVPGVDYTYYVRGKNAAGEGVAGSDDGWRGVMLIVDPETLEFDSAASAQGFTVCANVSSWSASKTAGWFSCKKGTTNVTVSVNRNDVLPARTNWVFVTAGSAHAVTAKVEIAQAGRPPKLDVGFAKPFVDWRTRMQISTNTTHGTTYEDYYAPVSVFTAGEELEISFGWTNKSETAVSMPSVRFSIYKPGESEPFSKWTAAGRSDERLETGKGAWSGHWQCGVIRILTPGDYMLKAEIAPVGAYDDIDRRDNTAVFRFAVLDPELDGKSELFKADDGWKNVELAPGNDFAQPPHFAHRSTPSGADVTSVQFGPYVPMNGLIGHASSGKAPLDLIFLIDVTGSMGGCIDALKNNIRAFFNELVTGDADHAPITDWRAKVIGYRDITCDYSWYEDHGFTTDVDAFNSHIAACRATGGGDTPESLLDAVWRIAKETEFREDASRVVVVFADAKYKTPMSYGGARGKGVDEAVRAAKEAGINLQLISSVSASNGASYMEAFATAISSNSYTYVSRLSSSVLNGDKLRELAKVVSSSVTETKVVEPMLSADVHGRGTLLFDWCNDSTAGTNNTFTFTCDTNNMSIAAGSGWQTVSNELSEGWHHFKWAYGKRDYDGVVTDCGVIANLRWVPYPTTLEIIPATMPVDHLGLAEVPKYAFTNSTDYVNDAGEVTNTVVTYGAVFTVNCNSVWKVVETSDWIRVVRGEGEGNGELIVEVAANTKYAERTGSITVVAGEYGLPSDNPQTNVVKVVQKPKPYEETDQVQIVSVGVKPRWPWNEWVDIDFIVMKPKTTTQSVKVTFVGVNQEGGDMLSYFTPLYNERECVAKKNVIGNEVEYIDSSKVKFKCITCPTSGPYRVSWRMGQDWKDQNTNGLLQNKDMSFHTPAFSVRLKAECDGYAAVELPSDPVRVDMRVKGSDTTEYSGGAILTGEEMIGHPTGYVDPYPYDTTDKALFPSNGWNSLNFVSCLPGDYSNNYARACVINDAYIEGGVITEDTTWYADKEHVVRDNVFIAPNAKLTIEEGAIVKFCYATYIFIYKDPRTEKEGTEDEFNIIMKGVYMTSAFDDSYGDNILRHSRSGDNSEWGDGQGTKSRIYSKNSAGLKYQVSENDGRAVIKIALERLYVNSDGSYQIGTTFKNRYYTRDQVWGDLPRPSESGLEFYGWYVGSPTQYLMEDRKFVASKYPARKYMINPSSKPYQDKSNRIIAKGQIYALLCPIGWAESVWDLIDASHGIVTISPKNVYYNGEVQKPLAENISVSVSDSPIDRSNYEIDYGTGDYKTAGDYPITVNFTVDYSSSLAATYSILPRSTEGGAIVFVPSDKKAYDRNLAAPLMKVSLPGMSDVVVSNDWTIAWDDTDRWPYAGKSPRPGVYSVTARLKASAEANYTGANEITGVFEITNNVAYSYDKVKVATLDAAKAKVTSSPRFGGGKRRILYIGGRADDYATQYVKDLLQNDFDIMLYLVDNYVCWEDADISAPTSKYALYSEGLDTDALPLLAVLSDRNVNYCLARSAGGVTKEELLKFLEDALEEPEPPSDASSATLTLSNTKFTYNGKMQRPTVTVKLASATVSAGNYDLVWSDGCTNVGAYTVKAVFKGSYIGETVTKSFEIAPVALEGTDVTLSPASATYNGTTQKPKVSVSVGALESVDYGVGDYMSAGTYTVTVTVGGSYTGTVHKTFTISKVNVSSATIELVPDFVAFHADKPPASPIKPSVIAVKDATRTYVEGIDYTLGWGAGDYMTAGTNTITATFMGNYSGSVTKNFVIEVAAAAAPSIDPAVGTVVEVTADNEASAIAKVTIAVPDAVKTSGVTEEAYGNYFKKTATKVGEGSYEVTAELDPKVVLPEEEADELGQVVLEAVLDVDVTEATITTAKPGLYYRLAGCRTPNGKYTNGEAKMADKDGKVTLEKPTISGTGNAVFYKVIVSAAP